jgi:hypothetical protein
MRSPATRQGAQRAGSAAAHAARCNCAVRAVPARAWRGESPEFNGGPAGVRSVAGPGSGMEHGAKSAAKAPGTPFSDCSNETARLNRRRAQLSTNGKEPSAEILLHPPAQSFMKPRSASRQYGWLASARRHPRLGARRSGRRSSRWSRKARSSNEAVRCGRPAETRSSAANPCEADPQN